MKRNKKVTAVILAVVLLGVVGTFCITYYNANKVSNVDENELPQSEIAVGLAKKNVSLHDPQVIQTEDGKYYMFGSHMTEAESDNLVDWSMIGDGVGKMNPMFDNLLEEPFDAFRFVGKNEDNGYSVWAPSVIYNKAMKKYVMYFCTTSSFIKSSLCMAVSDTPQGPYTYQEAFLHSGFIKGTVKDTNFRDIMGEDVDLDRYVFSGQFLNATWPNCIDPAAFYDAEGKMWMVYGSWSGGIFLLELDEQTGLPVYPESDDDENEISRYYGKRLIGGGHHAVEGPYIHYCEENGYYYLLVSYGNLTREGGYQIRQFRSKDVEGPYVDAKGNRLADEANFEEFGVKMAGNYAFPSLERTYMAPGGQSSFTTKDGKMYMVYHQRMQGKDEYHEPRIHQMFLTSDDWLTMAPFENNEQGVDIGEYTKEDLQGTFYVVNHGLDVSSKMRSAKEAIFATDGTITGEFQGSFELTENTNQVKLVLGGVTFNGVLFNMKDEAGNNTLCFSAVGENNKTVWGVHYLK